ncbi:MAG: SAM-dependent methyltransferase, partial [Chitinophagia bacterium]|nr:SAM-dependent methyltransferase [Chitinophagia bacterium]
YTNVEASPAVNKVLQHWYRDITGPYWDAERRYVDEGYRTIPFPFEEIPFPVFYQVQEWTVAQLSGYLGTWSGLMHYKKATGNEPEARITAELTEAYEGKERVQVRFPVHARVGIVTP